MEKTNKFKENFQPTIVLVLICLVITFALAYVNSITAPMIADNSARAANETRAALLPAANDFEAVNEADLVVMEEGKVWVSEAYKAKNGAGMVVTVKTKSFGGILTEMVAIDKDGKIAGVKVTAHSDTKGLGTKAHDADYLSQYNGLAKLDNAANIKADSTVNQVSGATISSNGVYQGVCCALMQFNK